MCFSIFFRSLFILTWLILFEISNVQYTSCEIAVDLTTRATAIDTAEIQNENDELLNANAAANHVNLVVEDSMDLDHDIDVLPSTIVNDDIESSCKSFIKVFAEQVANFTKCSVEYAQPIRVCENCVSQYAMAINTFDILMDNNTSPTEHAHCGTILTSDRVQIIHNTALYIKRVWRESYCDKCFEDYRIHNNTFVYKLAEEFSHYLVLFNETMACFQNYTDLPEQFGLESSNHTFSNICTNCLTPYNELNSYYKEIYNRDNGRVCMDIQDSVNVTRHWWSLRFKCLDRIHNQGAVLVLATVLCLLPAVFYVANRLYSEEECQRFLQERRLGAVVDDDDDLTGEQTDTVNLLH